MRLIMMIKKILQKVQEVEKIYEVVGRYSLRLGTSKIMYTFIICRYAIYSPKT